MKEASGELPFLEGTNPVGTNSVGNNQAESRLVDTNTEAFRKLERFVQRIQRDEENMSHSDRPRHLLRSEDEETVASDEEE